MASIDKMKMNLTPVEANKLLDKSLRGKSFEDGPYQYRMFVSTSSISGGVAGMIITVTNTPDQIAGDLIQYAVARIGIILRNYKEQFRIIPSKIWVDEFGHNINFFPLIGGSMRGEYLDIKHPDGIANMFGTYSIKQFVENHSKVKRKFVKFLEHVSERFRTFDLPAVPDEFKKDFNKKILPQMETLHPIAGRKKVIPPVNFKMTKIDANSDVSHNASSPDPDEVLKFKYMIGITIAADKTHPVIKTLDAIHNDRSYENPGRDTMRDILYHYQGEIQHAINKYIDTLSPVEAGVQYHFLYGSIMQGSGHNY